jgi:hypothetical protein
MRHVETGHALSLPGDQVILQPGNNPDGPDPKFHSVRNMLLRFNG